MGVLLQGFFFAPGRIAGVPSPLDGDKTIPFWWDHLAAQAHQLGTSGFTAIWLPPQQKGASGSFSSGYDEFDDYGLGSKDQKGTIPTRYGTREQLARCAAVLRANGIDIYLDLVENQRDRDDGCLLGFGRLGDRIGLLRVYIDGLGVFGASSLGCALARGLGTLVLLRGLEGTGAVMVGAISVALLASHVPRPRVGWALGWQTGLTYAGLALGPVAGGLAAQRFGWRAVFAAGRRALRALPRPAAWIGAAAAFAAAVLLA